MREKIPVTLVVGFLGSGKTTFINNILHGDHGKKIAVIENEFGDVGIDDELLKGGEDLIVEMNNGCICCSMKGDLVESLSKLLDNSKDFDQIVIEATGMANPGPIIETFFSSPVLSESFILDSVIGLIDCAHYELNLKNFDQDEEVAFHDQIAFSESLLLNKVDLVSEIELKKIREKLRENNPHVKVFETTKAQVDLSLVMGRSSFDLSLVEDSMPKPSGVEYPFAWGGVISLQEGTHRLSFNHTHHNEQLVFFKVDEDDINKQAISYATSFFYSPKRRSKAKAVLSTEEHILLDFQDQHFTQYSIEVEHVGKYAFFLSDSPKHLQMNIEDKSDSAIEIPKGVEFKKMTHSHGDKINSVSFEFEGALNPHSFEMFLNVLYTQYSNNIYRSKGVLHFEGNDQRVVFQGVYSSVQFDHGREWGSDKRVNKIVFIGKGLVGASLEAGIKNCRV
ncbi:hypothetical protein A9Q84_01905 [Halobacteriovorax marinus]|uniref:CobW C-terminal domain-containing protein n=1 Tax=Halobacteriovorax marinus TaxID=97084 RepID=A0A1Y5FGB5_9BACT|nr:hypothetical protein A9Q84_01905 [Halobacteriovorax marinus]